MGRWYEKAAKAFANESADTPQPFTLDCECGQSHSGVRRRQHQRLICKTCGRVLFVLPRNVYPVPKPSEPAPPSSTDETPAMTPAAAGEPPPIASLRKRTRKSAPPNPPLQAEQSSRAPVPEPGRPPLKTKARRSESAQPASDRGFWTSFRILFACVIGISLLTGIWLVRQSLLSAARKTARDSGEKALQLIQEQNWSEARRQLEPAVLAVNRLGRTDAESQTLRDYSQEIRALLNLCSDSLLDVVQTMKAEFEARPPGTRHATGLGKHYRGQWVIVEGTVHKTDPLQNRSSDQLEMPLPGIAALLGKEAVLEFRSSPLEQFLSPENEKFLVFSGEISDCQWDELNQHWVIGLAPHSVFLWSHLDTYLAAGFEFSPARTEQQVTHDLEKQSSANRKNAL